MILLGLLIPAGKLNIGSDLPLYHLHLNITEDKQGHESNHSGSDARAAFGVCYGPQ